MEELRTVLSHDFTFDGPFHKSKSADEYVNALKSDPPKGCAYEIIHSFEHESWACVVFQFSKPGICVPMSQLFEIRHGKISKVLLIFDTGVFTKQD